MIQTRRFHPQDAHQIAQLFHDTIRQVNLGDYTLAQVQAWAPDDLDFRHWIKACSSRITYVADDGGVILGFGELETNGHIDCFYIHKDYQGQGVGRQIYQTIESKALDLSLPRLFLEASITARPFFERMGFVMVKEQQVIRRGQWLTNVVMEKKLSVSSPTPSVDH